MYTILLIDDEKSIRDNLPLAVPFEAAGFTVASTASNGQEALDRLPSVNPDLILLDVCMPVMDGLQFLRRLREGDHAGVRVVMLSGFSDFAYAKEAMKYGVKAYVTKPADEEELLPLLAELRQELDEERDERSRGSLQGSVRTLGRMFAGERGERRAFSDFGLLTCVLWPCPDAFAGDDPHLTLQACLVRFDASFEHALFRARGSQYTYLLPNSLVSRHTSRKAFCEALLAALQAENLACSLMLDPWIFHHETRSLREDHADHLHAMLGHLFHEGGTILEYHPAVYPAGRELPRRLPMLEDMRRHLDARDARAFLGDLDALCDEIVRLRPDMLQVQEVTYRIYYMLLDAIAAATGEDGEDTYLARPEWMDLPYFVPFRRWCGMQRDMVNEAFTFLARTNEMASLGIGQEVVAYIHAHYQEQITLMGVAERFFVNADHLGRVFQKVTGVSFKQYVNNLRIAEAKKLLLATDKRIYEIATEVGYQESKYFIAKFTQAVGKSPTAYRSQM